MKKYFGTDGIRGEANHLLTPELALKVGQYLGHQYAGKKIVIGKDTRLSGDMLEHALASGMVSSGADVYLLGVCATPALAYTIGANGFAAGVMISASHNPFYDNGLKVFDETGMKISDELEHEVERYLEGEVSLTFESDKIGRVHPYTEGIDTYINHIEDIIQGDFNGLKIVLDLAHGSAVSSARRLFEDLKAELIVMNESPDGININYECGSTHMDGLIERVKLEKADLGFAFDGDADRCLAVDHLGNYIDGDKILYVLSKGMIEAGVLDKNTVVSTVMSNLGFIKSMEREKINVVQTDVGDKNVFKEMVEQGYKLGGEQSGHVILMDYATTGDGVLTALKLAEIVSKSKQSLHDLSKDCMTYPQVLKNIVVKDKKKVMHDVSLDDLIKNVETALNDQGRVLVRASGTEPLVRVMIEAETEDICHQYVDLIIEHIEKL